MQEDCTELWQKRDDERNKVVQPLVNRDELRGTGMNCKTYESSRRWGPHPGSRRRRGAPPRCARCCRATTARSRRCR